MDTHDKFSLDVDAPDRVPAVLETIADRYRESVYELQAAWGDKSGEIWGDFARILDRAADSCRTALKQEGILRQERNAPTA